MQDGGFLDYLGILIAFCAILFLAWLTTRLVGKRFSVSQGAKRMRVVETLPLGVDRALMLVQVGQKHYLLATSRGRTDFMGEVDPGPEPQPDAESRSGDFKSILERYAGLGRRQEQTGETPSNPPPEDGIAAGIRRLRAMNGEDKGDNHPHG